MLLNADISVGLLGGSFNPAHDGHLYISEEAIKRLGLNQVWWLVSPQNPLKPKKGMAPLEQRMEGAKKIVGANNKIRVSDIELELETTYTRDTLVKLRQLYPRVRFVWLMGADNLAQLPEWHCWQEFFSTTPIAVFSRENYTSQALNGKVARYFMKHRVADAKLRNLVNLEPPAWGFLNIKTNLSSSSELRKKKKGDKDG